VNEVDYNYTTNSYSTTDGSIDSGAAFAIFMTALVIGLVVAAIMYIFISICLMKIFKKAGIKESWKAWVPIYNTWVLYQIAGRPGWWIFLNFIPIVGLVTSIIAYVDLVKSFGKDPAWAVLLVFIPIVGYPILAWDSSRYLGPAGPDRNQHNTNYAPESQQPVQPPTQPPSF
jgi:hypothetical protein